MISLLLNIRKKVSVNLTSPDGKNCGKLLFAGSRLLFAGKEDGEWHEKGLRQQSEWPSSGYNGACACRPKNILNLTGIDFPLAGSSTEIFE
jgi:hypothetical protein